MQLSGGRNVEGTGVTETSMLGEKKKIFMHGQF